jgi:hypothetical protein
MSNSKVILTPFARLSFPHLFKPSANDQGTLLYSCVLLFPKDIDAAGKRLGLAPAIIAEGHAALKAMKALAAETALEFYGGKDKVPNGIKSQDLGKASGWPFRDQKDRAGQYDGYEDGALYISISSQNKPTILDRNKNEILEEQDLYPGCWVRASIGCYGYRAKGNTGVSFGLRNIQKLCDDENISGRSRATDEFSAIDVSEDSSESADSLFG